MKFKVAQDCTSISVGGIEYQCSKGVVEVPDENVAGIESCHRHLRLPVHNEPVKAAKTDTKTDPAAD